MGVLTAGRSEVTFYSTRGEAFVLFVNGERVNHRPATKIYVNNIYPGRNRVNVRIHKRRGVVEINAPIYVDAGFASDYAISSGRNGRVKVNKVNSRPIYGNKPGGVRHRKSGGIQDQYRHGPKNHRLVHMNVEALLHDMSYLHFDDEKLGLAKSALRDRVITTQGVIRIMDQLTFDRRKLDFALAAFGHVVDKNQYYRVKGAFTFRFTAQELDRKLQYNFY